MITTYEVDLWYELDNKGEQTGNREIAVTDDGGVRVLLVPLEGNRGFYRALDEISSLTMSKIKSLVAAYKVPVRDQITKYEHNYAKWLNTYENGRQRN